MAQKRLVTIQDLSCFGRCSLTTALPIISALGIETAVIPTAVLSTHTGEFKNYTFHSMNNEFDKIAQHWKSLDIAFDAIYVGYIGTCDMIDRVIDFIDTFGKNSVVFVDPAMADNGKLYSGISSDYPEHIKRLCSKADIISPNLTEALILSGKNPEDCFNLSDKKSLLDDISKIAKNTIITSLHSEDSIITSVRTEAGATLDIKNKKYGGVFYGSGDIFASTCIGAYLCNNDICKSARIAAEFVAKCIENTIDERDKYWYGLNFEKCLGMLTEYASKRP